MEGTKAVAGTERDDTTTFLESLEDNTSLEEASHPTRQFQQSPRQEGDQDEKQGQEKDEADPRSMESHQPGKSMVITKPKTQPHVLVTDDDAHRVTGSLGALQSQRTSTPGSTTTAPTRRDITPSSAVVTEFFTSLLSAKTHIAPSMASSDHKDTTDMHMHVSQGASADSGMILAESVPSPYKATEANRQPSYHQWESTPRHDALGHHKPKTQAQATTAAYYATGTHATSSPSVIPPSPLVKVEHWGQPQQLRVTTNPVVPPNQVHEVTAPRASVLANTASDPNLIQKLLIGDVQRLTFTGERDPEGSTHATYTVWERQIRAFATASGCIDVLTGDPSTVDPVQDRNLGYIILRTLRGPIETVMAEFIIGHQQPSGRRLWIEVQEYMRLFARRTLLGRLRDFNARIWRSTDTVTSFISDIAVLYREIHAIHPTTLSKENTLMHILGNLPTAGGFEHFRHIKYDLLRQLDRNELHEDNINLKAVMDEIKMVEQYADQERAVNERKLTAGTKHAVHAAAFHQAPPLVVPTTDKRREPTRPDQACTHCRDVLHLRERAYSSHTMDTCRNSKRAVPQQAQSGTSQQEKAQYEKTIADLSRQVQELTRAAKNTSASTTTPPTKIQVASTETITFHANATQALFDTCASATVTCDQTLVDDFQPITKEESLSPPMVLGTGGKASPVIGYGRLTLQWDMGDTEVKLICHRVIVSPDCGVNVIAASTIVTNTDGTPNGTTFKLSSDGAYWELDDGKCIPVTMGKDDGLLWFHPNYMGPSVNNEKRGSVNGVTKRTMTYNVMGDARQVSPNNFATHATKILTDQPDREVTYQYFHEVLGHAGKRATIDTAARYGIVLTGDTDIVCHTCAENKSSSLSLDGDGHKADKCGDLVHLDIWGPTSEMGFEGERYAFVLRDHVSGWIEGRFVSSTSDIISALQDITREDRMRPTNQRVNIGGHTVFQWDNDPVSRSAAFKDYMAAEGFAFRACPPYTHQQNGVAESVFKATVPKVRAILNPSGKAKIPRVLWALAYQHIIYLHNRTTTPRLKGMSPFEVITGEAPKFGHLRLFGCTAFAHAHARKGSKLDPTAVRGIYAGHDTVNDSAIIYVPATQAVRGSVHVTFDEATQGVLPEDPVVQDVTPPSEALDEHEDIDVATTLVEGEDEVTMTTTPSVATTNNTSMTTPVTNTPTPETTMTTPVINTPTPVTTTTPSVPSNPTQAVAPVVTRAGRTVKPNQRYQDVHTAFVTSVRAANKGRDDFTLALEDDESDELSESAEHHGQEPRSLKQALNGPDAERWMAAIETELQTLVDLGAWAAQERVDVPPGARVIPCMFVFKMKRDEEGRVTKYKARLTAKGNHQRPGIDFGDVSAPTVHADTLRTMLSVAAATGMSLHHIDIKAAYLQGDLGDDEIFIHPPPFLGTVQPEIGKSQVLKLQRPLYGAMQAGHKWYSTLKDFLVADLGFGTYPGEPCLFMTDGLLVCLYVDDIPYAAATEERATWFKSQLFGRFQGTYLGPLRWCLGIRIDVGTGAGQRTNTVSLSQEAYANTILKTWGMADAFGSNIPIRRELFAPGVEDPCGETEQGHYRRLVGELNYLATWTRPDLAVAVSKLAQRLGRATKNDLLAAKDVLRYLRDTKHYGISYGGEVVCDNVLVGYADAAFAVKDQGRHSTTGYVFYVNGGPVCWATKRQDQKPPPVEHDGALPASSTCEAEVIACSAATKACVFLRNLLRAIGHEQRGPTTIYEDNQAAMHYATNITVSRAMRHLEIADMLVREAVANKLVHLEFCPGKHNVADGLTKLLDPILHERFVRALMKTA